MFIPSTVSARLRGIPYARSGKYPEPAGASAQSSGAGGEPTLALGAATLCPDGRGRGLLFLGTTPESSLPSVGDSGRCVAPVGAIRGVCLRTATRSRGTEESPEKPAGPGLM